MAMTFRPYDPDQLLVLPPSLREWLPEDHRVYLLNDVVDSLDLSVIYQSYSEASARFIRSFVMITNRLPCRRTAFGSTELGLVKSMPCGENQPS